eukprot:331444_1
MTQFFRDHQVLLLQSGGDPIERTSVSLFVVWTEEEKYTSSARMLMHPTTQQRAVDSVQPYRILNQQFLYNEVEAEVDLDFDRLIFNVAKQMFVYSKECASQLMLDKTYKVSMGGALKDDSLDVGNKRFHTLMEQRNANIMGRSVDFQSLISQHVNRDLRDNISAVIQRFESQSLSSIVVFVANLRQVDLSHALMSIQLNLDPYKTMFEEVNESVALGALRGRVILQILRELSLDLFRDTVFHSATLRFTRPKDSFVDLPERPKQRSMPQHFGHGSKFNKVYSNALKLSRGFYGVPHVQAMLTLLEPGDIALIIDECVQNAESQINNVLQPYFSALNKAIPGLKRPSAQFGAAGAYTAFDLKLKPVAGYGPLRSGVFQTLREVGNSLCFIFLLEQVMEQNEFFEFQAEAFFHGVKPGVQGPAEEKRNEYIPLQIPEKPLYMDVLKDAVQNCTDPTMQSRANQLLTSVEKSQQPLNSNRATSYFASAIHRIAILMHNAGLSQEWSGSVAVGGFLEMASPRDFARIWSVLQFLMCQASDEEIKNGRCGDLENFGESMIWAGMIILHILNQRSQFDFMDFTYYILELDFIEKLKSVDDDKAKKKKKKTGAPVRDPQAEVKPYLDRLLEAGKFVRKSNDYVLSVLQSHYVPPPRFVQTFHPISEKEPEWREDTFRSKVR